MSNHHAGHMTIMGQTFPLFSSEPQPEDEYLTCISLWQPWAQWVMLGWKTIETRTHNRFKSLVGKRVGIHATHKWDRATAKLALPYLTKEQLEQTGKMYDQWQTSGQLLGTVEVTQSRLLVPADAPQAMIECDTTRYGLFLRDPQPFEKPIPAKGMQGIWRHKMDDSLRLRMVRGMVERTHEIK